MKESKIITHLTVNIQSGITSKHCYSNMSGSGEHSKTVKVALKEARELIEKKDYKAALRCCKKCLNVDKDNYMALVFCGLCLGELDQPDQAVQVKYI